MHFFKFLCICLRQVLKWNFTTPTDEHLEQLQGQLATVCKPALHVNLFNANFKLQLKALETLTQVWFQTFLKTMFQDLFWGVIQCLETAPDASTTSSDLLLKWCTLRFFETNPSVLIKSLEYIQQLLQLLVDRDCELHDYEVTAFVPYLLLKAGDQKDAVRYDMKGNLCNLVSRG